MGIQINGQTDTITAVDGGLIVSGADFTGVSAGSTSAPSISPTGDSNTGIFFPSADTIAFAEGGVEALRIDSSANIGIGTNSPGAGIKLDVVGGEIKAGRVDSSQEGGQVSFGRATDNATGWYIDVYGNTSTPSLRFVDVSNSAVRATIDGSGRLTLPYQPSFKVGWNARNATGSNRILSTNAGDTVQLDRDTYNIGSHFNTATGRFTAPVTGTYMFIFSVMRNFNSGSVVNIRIQKNTTSTDANNMYSRIYQGAYASSYQQDIIVTTTVLSVSDYVNVSIDGSTSIYNDDTYFAGHLLG